MPPLQPPKKLAFFLSLLLFLFLPGADPVGLVDQVLDRVDDLLEQGALRQACLEHGGGDGRLLQTHGRVEVRRRHWFLAKKKKKKGANLF